MMTNIEIQENVPLAPHTTLRVGGKADHFVTVRGVDALREAVVWARVHNEPIRVLGGGSNVLVPDHGYRGLVIKNEIRGVAMLEEAQGSVLLGVEAGTDFDELVAHTVAKGWWGLENLSHIPGSVGATPIQNVGAYGVEVSDVIEWVAALDTTTDEIVEFNNASCAFSYRNSFFKSEEGKKFVVLRVAYRLHTTPQPDLSYRDLAETFKNKTPSQREIREAVIAIRAKKFPDWHTTGTAGSFFKNPIIEKVTYDELRSQYPELPGYTMSEDAVKIPLGWVLDHILGLRGLKDGHIESYKGQALVLVAHEGASAKEIETFANTIATKVFDATGIVIEREVTTLL